MASKPINSFYPIYKLYYGKTSNATQKQRKTFGMAINNAENIICQAFVHQSCLPIQKFLDLEQKNGLTTSFLENFLGIIGDDQNLFRELKHEQRKLLIPTPGCRYDKLNVRYAYLYDKKNSRLIILTYGKSQNIGEEFGIVRVLCDNFSEVPLPASIQNYEYWDLSEGKIETVASNDVIEINIQRLDSVIKKLAS
ncbi:hypothetical protein [Calidifontibacillus erzurumensis]|uniref:Uncharacterized protein n=1 Tax=Calidifontibacillus erzurumensis TaxID=2741433 RepID=A0A8J8GG28_9BACI|nr:hypothetical protein [Calidifontibacillus erzurumensis]NSL52722.1 hypothetical protein [Calidifontibacillus erzurumensis]